MIEKDTVRLLRECDAGIKMGVQSIDDVLDKVESDVLRKRLHTCKKRHEELGEELEVLLNKYHDDGKKPNPMATSMSWIKTNMMLMADRSGRY